MFKKGQIPEVNLNLKSSWKRQTAGDNDLETDSTQESVKTSSRLNPLSAIKKLTLKSDEPDTRDYFPASPNLELDNSNPLPMGNSKDKSKLTPNLNFKLKSSNDSLSNGLESMPFGIYELQKYGIVGNVDTLAYDPIQSLMAAVTNFNHIYIFGQARVMVELKLDTVSPIRALKFIKGCYLIAVDKSNTIFVISIHQKKVIHTLIALAPIVSYACDYSLEFVYVGLKDGTVRAFNIETGKPTILSLKEQQTEIFPNDYQTEVKSLKIHPRDLGTLLISYTKVTIVYNLVNNTVINQFIYSLPKTAPGGENGIYEYESDGLYYPKIVHCLWHPNGLHALTVHNDNSIVFWDAKTGKKILARTLFDSEVDEPTGQTQKPQKQQMTHVKKIEWLCESNSEKTSLLILGGDGFSVDGYHQLVRMDFGTMLSYSMTSYSQMAKYYSHPKEQRIFAIHSKAEIIDFVPLGESSPYFNYCHGPRLIGVTMSDGSMKFLHYPEGNLLLNAQFFPATVSWLNPKITSSSSSFMDRKILNSILPNHGKQMDLLQSSILKGGIPARPRYKAVMGSLILTGHESGFIRIWDSSEGDLNTSKVFEIDISDILERDDDSVTVSNISFANESLELSCSLKSGDVLLFSHGINRVNSSAPRPSVTNLHNSARALNNITDRASVNVRRGFLPKLLIKPLDNGLVTALNNSNIGLVAIGYESGRILIIDRKTNSVAYNEVLKEQGLGLPIHAKSIEFGYGLSDKDTKPGAMIFVGTDIGRLLTYKITGSPGNYRVNFISSLDNHDEGIEGIMVVNSQNGKPMNPSLGQMANPSIDTKFHPLVVTYSRSDIRIVKNNNKLSHKSYNKGDISKVGITGAQTPKGLAFGLVVLLGISKQVVCLTIPGLTENSKLRIPYRLDANFAKQSSILPLGDIFIRITQTEAALVNIMKIRQPIMSMETSQSTDTLFLRNLVIPWRPEMKTVLRNAPKITYTQLHQLLTGKDRAHDAPQLPDYDLAWDVSCYNPMNYTYLTAHKPVYFDPNAIKQHPQLQKAPIRHEKRQNQKGWVGSMTESVNGTFDAAQNVVDEQMTRWNDDFDDAVEKAKKDAIKSVFSGKFL